MGSEQKTGTLDLESLKGQRAPLSPEQEDDLQNQIFDKFYKEDEPKEEETELPNDDQEGAESGKSQKKDDSEAQDDGSGTQDKDESQAGEQDKAKIEAEKKAKEEADLKAKEEADKKAADEAFQKEAEEYAKENEISVEQAKQELESEIGIAKKYENDPRKLARAYRNIQTLYSKNETELKKIKSEPEILAEGEMVFRGKRYTKEQTRAILIDAYRKDHKEQSEAMDDDEVYQTAIDQLKKRGGELAKAEAERVKAEAIKRRTDYISGLSESDKKFADEVKEIIEMIPDHVVTNDNFSIKDTVFWVKGKHYDDDLKSAVKEAEERGYKRGVEERKIIGERPPVGGGAAPKKKEAGADTLTPDEKERALEMYQSIGNKSDEEKYAMFAEYKKHEQGIGKRK